MQYLPLVSICIPTYNGATYIREALDSAMAQTYANLEIIVSDDGSSDDTLQIVRSYQKDSSMPFKVVEHEARGIGANWNNCIANSEGEFIKFLFQDDLLDPDCVQALVSRAYSSENSGVLKMVFSKRRLIGDGDFTPGDLEKYYENYEDIIDGKSILEKPNLYSIPRNKIGEPVCVLLHRSVFDEVGLFDNRLKQSLDYEFWYRICSKNNVGFVSRELVSFRIHRDQTTSRNNKTTIIDTYLIPKIFLQNYFSILHRKTRSVLIRKLLSGFVLYYLIRPFTIK